VKTREGTVNPWNMAMHMLNGNGNEYRGVLLSLGLEITPGSTARQALHEYICTARPDERWRSVDRIGWHGQVFVLPDDDIFGDAGGGRIMLQTSNGCNHAFKTAGTLEGWQEDIARYCAGNSRLAFAVSCAFAAPLLNLAGLEGGGFHFRGESSRGKTTALHVAGSVWGGGDMGGYIKTWRSTSNGMEALGLGHCDALLCLDEMSLMDAREVGEAAEMLSNGMGKSRARQDGLGAPLARWRTLFLSTGEVALADKLAEVGRKARAGQEVRLADIPADAGQGLGIFEDLHDFSDPAALADHLRQAAGQHYGHPIRSFLETICRTHTQELSGTIRNYGEAFTAQACPGEADGQVKRAARRFGLVAAAGEMAISLEILPWPERETLEAAHACFLAWLDSRGGTGAHEVREIVSQVKYFMEKHGESRFTPWNAEKGARTVNRAGFRKAIDADLSGGDGHGGWEYYVLRETFGKELCAGFDKRLVIRVLREHDYIIPGSDGKTMSTHKPPALGKPIKLYKFSSTILADE
jgi:putative DNA primase/helicase